MKRLDFTNQSLRENNEAKAYINNCDEGMIEYYPVFAKPRQPLPREPQFSDIYHHSKGQKNGKLLFDTVETGLTTHAL